MDLTFSYRRKMITEGHHSLKKIKEKYPFLFEREQLRKEYNQLLADENAADCMKHNLLELAPKIISVAEKRNLAAKEAQDLLQLCCQLNDADVDEAEITEGMCT
ncbi:Hypothetical predicted protein [Paramuricea clavata]|uniref:Uncharacterized protein n=1 Tax=Paramuricea clavata TaxID=317549 RepID=A0A7D9JSQ2_PARCT|nr:Hypothetical predicted protein [Paramuricea clavata]